MTSPIAPVVAQPAGARRPRGPPDTIYLSVNPNDIPWTPEDEILEEFFFDDELTRQFIRDKTQCEILNLLWISACLGCPCVFWQYVNADAVSYTHLTLPTIYSV